MLLARPLSAQALRPLVEAGVGTLAPDDPFVVTMVFRATAGMTLGGKDALSVEYSLQSANRVEGEDFGKYSRSFVGIAWQHAFRDAFSDPEPKRLQYLARVGGGTLVRGTFPEAVGDQELRNAPFVDAGVVIRYPLSAHVTAVGTVQDAMAFLPAQTVQSYCATQNGQTQCYVQGGPDYFTIDRPASTQHNLGVILTFQLKL